MLLGSVKFRLEISKVVYCQALCLVIVVLNGYLLIWCDYFVWSTTQLNPSHVFTEMQVCVDSTIKKNFKIPLLHPPNSGQEVWFRRLWLGRQKRGLVNDEKVTSQNSISPNTVRSENYREREREITKGSGCFLFTNMSE